MGVYIASSMDAEKTAKDVVYRWYKAKGSKTALERGYSAGCEACFAAWGEVLRMIDRNGAVERLLKKWRLGGEEGALEPMPI